MLCVRAPLFEKRLEQLSKATGKTKSYFVRSALELLFGGIIEEKEEKEEPIIFTYLMEEDLN